MDPIQQLTAEVKTLAEKVETVARSVQTVKRIFVWMLIGMLLSFILPLIGLVFVLPSFLANYQAALNF